MSWSDPHVVPASAAGTRFVDYVKAHLIAVPVNEIGDAMTGAGGVRAPDILLDGNMRRTDHRLRGGEAITLLPSLHERLVAENRLTPAAEMALDVLHEDASIVILNKPAGTHVHPVGRYRDATLMNGLVHRAGATRGSPWGAWRPHPAHRLDRPVSGVLVVAKNAEVSGALNELQLTGKLARRYLVWVDGVTNADHGTIELPVGRDPVFDYRRAVLPLERGGQSAITHWRVRERRSDRTQLEIDLETGRTHQIRVHMAAIGHRVCGDTLYLQPAGPSALRIALHSWHVSFAFGGREIDSARSPFGLPRSDSSLASGSLIDLSAEPPPGFDSI